MLLKVYLNLQFGATSVGSVKSILSLKHIVENEARRQPIVVVVSALGGITDKLLSTAQQAVSGNEAWKISFEEMVDRHHKMIDTIITNTIDREDLFNKVDALFEQLRSIYFGVYLIRDLSRKTQDAIVRYGERLSSNIVSRVRPPISVVADPIIPQPLWPRRSTPRCSRYGPM